MTDRLSPAERLLRSGEPAPLDAQTRVLVLRRVWQLVDEASAPGSAGDFDQGCGANSAASNAAGMVSTATV